jgi:hypothetical protein
MSYGFGASTSTDGQLQRIDEDRLACAGFAGEHCEPASEVDLDGVDDREVSNVQMREHAWKVV